MGGGREPLKSYSKMEYLVLQQDQSHEQMSKVHKLPPALTADALFTQLPLLRGTDSDGSRGNYGRIPASQTTFSAHRSSTVTWRHNKHGSGSLHNPATPNTDKSAKRSLCLSFPANMALERLLQDTVTWYDGLTLSA